MLHNSNKETILKNEVQENTLAIYLEDEQINYIPEKDSGYTLDLTKSSCTNGVTIGFDYNTWSVKTNYSNYTNPDNTRIKCSLYFKKRTFAESLVDCGALFKDVGTCIKENYYLTEEVVDDETVDNNLRFIGANPENYVWFNDELWRIIGVMNNIDDGNGNKETRLKIIRDEPIGEYSWDNKGSNGENNWSTSALQMVLNKGAYYNRTNGNCPYGGSESTTTCDFSSIGLTNEAKTMINNAVWNLGGVTDYTSNSNGLASRWYNYERGTTVYTGRPTTWTGQIGLMYPSDYGYATSGGDNGRTTCLQIPLSGWYNHSYCYNNDWLFIGNDGYQWTMTPHSSYSYVVFDVNSSGYVGYRGTSDHTNRVFSPATYLSSNVKIVGGDGSKSFPFILSL